MLKTIRFPQPLTLLLAWLTAVPVCSGEPAPPPLAASVSGRVLLDTNRNGKIDDADQGLADVVVTDGIQQVRTVANGSYSLKFAADPLIPYQPAQVLAVSWPSGTWPVGRGFYVRRADIKPGQKVDFLLRQQKQSLPFTFAHGTDPHDNLNCGKEFFGDDIQRMQDRVAFCLMTGDLGYATREGAEKMFADIGAVTRRFPIPLLHAPGNHDIVGIHTMRWADQDPLAGYGPYTQQLGPIRSSFTYAGVHFVGLDWARILPEGKLETGVPDTVIAWLKKDLARLKPGTRIFLFMHHDFRHGDDTFWDVLVEHKVELVLAGHSHRNKEETRRGIPRLTTQNLCGPYRLVTVLDQGHAIVNRCYAGSAAGHRHSYAGKCKMTLDAKAFAAKHGIHKELVEKKVAGVLPIESFQARQLEVVADIDPAAAKTVGLRIGTGKDSLGLAFHPETDELHLGALRTAAVRGRGDKIYHLRLIVADGKMLLYANNRVQVEKAFTFNQPGPVELFADGAVFTKVDVWEIK